MRGIGTKGLVKCDHLKVWGKKRALEPRDKNSCVERKCQSAQTCWSNAVSPGKHPLSLLQPVVEVTRKPNTMAPLSEPPRTRARHRRGRVKIKQAIPRTSIAWKNILNI